MIKPTHIIEWDSELPLGNTPVLYCEYKLECAVHEGEEGRELYPTAFHMNTGRNRLTGECEYTVTLPVPSHDALKEHIKQAVLDDDMPRAFEHIFTYMMVASVQKDELLLDEIC